MMGTKQRYTSHAETAVAAGIWRKAGLALLKSAAAFIVLAGTGGAWLGGQWHLPFLSVIQPAAAAVIAIIVMYNGYRIIAGSVSQSKRPERSQEEDAAELSKAVERIEGVITVNGLRAWEQGHYVAVDIRISVNPRITVLEGHEIGRRVKDHLLKRFLHVSDVSIHVDPYDPGYPYKSNHDPNQEHIPTLLQ
jgi:divalent metal cation (Fe/Co/Zn/Cd) transporter